MAVDAATLAGLQHELVEAEGRHPELPAEGDEALGRIEVQPRAGDAGFHGENATRARVDRAARGDTDVRGSMVLTTLTAIMAAALGGAVALDATVLIIAAVVALVVIGVINGLKAIRELTGYLRT